MTTPKKSARKATRWTKTDELLSDILIESGACSIGELITVFKEATKDRDYSGQFRLRLPRTLHKELVMQAKAQGVSLNTHVIYKLGESK